ncbi:MAG: HEPN domain-containing protein [Candidatus Aenigmarchaeota archaeon]|nr:HEPN domain-containing protein [Candidatus Aenigmarchaeota archaeon]
MKKPSFLRKLKKEGKLELVEPSEEICRSYTEKADNCLKSAKLLLQHNLYENSVSMSYYTMYNLLTALLFKCGMKCENHAASIILFKRLFGRADLFKIISFAKEERIDKQYYVTSEKDFVLTKEATEDMLKMAEDFLVKMKLLTAELKNEQIVNLREKFKTIE